MLSSALTFDSPDSAISEEDVCGSAGEEDISVTSLDGMVDQQCQLGTPLRDLEKLRLTDEHPGLLIIL